MDFDFVYWADAESLLGAVDSEYKADEWSLLPCNGSHFASAPVLSS